MLTARVYICSTGCLRVGDGYHSDDERAYLSSPQMHDKVTWSSGSQHSRLLLLSPVSGSCGVIEYGNAESRQLSIEPFDQLHPGQTFMLFSMTIGLHETVVYGQTIHFE